MEDYSKLVEKLQNGDIDTLEFVLSQENLAELYIEEMQSIGITPAPDNAEQWLVDYENNNLYQSGL